MSKVHQGPMSKEAAIKLRSFLRSNPNVTNIKIKFSRERKIPAKYHILYGIGKEKSGYIVSWNTHSRRYL